jgi:hypothetical protein
MTQLKVMDINVKVNQQRIASWGWGLLYMFVCLFNGWPNKVQKETLHHMGQGCYVMNTVLCMYNIVWIPTKCILVKWFSYIITSYTFWLLMQPSLVRHTEDNYWSGISVLLFCNYLITHCKSCAHVYSCHYRMVHYCMKRVCMCIIHSIMTHLY